VSVEAPERPSWAVLAAIALVALVLRVVCVAQYEANHPLRDRPAIDEASYDSWAREIAAGDVLGREIFFQEPLYPYFLGGVYALAGDEPQAQRSAARHVQAALGALTAVLVALLGARAFGAKAGALGGFAFALYLPAIWFAALLLKPGLFLPLLAAFLLVLSSASRPRSWLLAGLLAGLGALLRGNMLVLLPFVALWPLARAVRRGESRTQALASIAAVVVGVALALGPVVARNHHVGGRFVLTTSGAGTNLYGGNNLANPYGVATEFDWVRGVPEHEAADWRREASRRTGRELDATETSSYWMGAALESMRSEPLEHARILARKLHLALNRFETPDNHFLEWDERYVPLLRAPLPSFGIIGWLGLCGLGLCALDGLRRRGAARAGTLAAFFVLYLGTIVATVMSDRARLPLVVMLAPFAAWFALEQRRWLDAPRSMLANLPVVALAAGLVFSTAMPDERRRSDFDERDHNLAVNLLAEGDLEGCAPLVEQLLARHPGAARVNLLVAEYEYRRARAILDAAPAANRISEDAGRLLDSAFTRLEGVSRRGSAQERFRAQALGGAMRQYFGHWKAAEPLYRAALSFDPSDRDLRRRLAVVLAESAMLDPASPERATRLAESIALLEQLLAEAPDDEVRALLERIRRATG
jgi:4-amino-4-deoxy-L-arabinose transferase-like glycosyltransferase